MSKFVAPTSGIIHTEDEWLEFIAYYSGKPENEIRDRWNEGYTFGNAVMGSASKRDVYDTYDAAKAACQQH